MLTTRQIILMPLINLWLIGLFAFVFNSTNAQEGNKPMHPAPVIAWTLSNLCYGDTTYFTNNTTGEVYNNWTIKEVVESGDSIIYASSDKHLKFLFPEIAIYKVELMADNGHQVYLERTLVYNTFTNAYFDYQDCNSAFTNLSMCFTSCVWDFGDGTPTSTEINPSHFYEATGTYTTRLKVTNGTVVDSVEIDINSFAVNEFKGGFTAINEGDSVLFVANDSLLSPGFMYEYHWAFGDGEVADLYGNTGGTKLRHHYAYKDSTYMVFLLEKTSCSKKYTIQNVYVPDNTPVVGDANLFPNPFTEILHVTSARKTEMTDIKILNYLGQELPNLQVTQKSKGYDLNLSAFPAGFYFVRFYFGEEVITKRIIKN
jgi:PKD repeat protein